MASSSASASNDAISPPSSATAAAATGAATINNKGKSKPYFALWDLDSKGVDAWLYSVATLFQPQGNKKGGKTTPPHEQSTFDKSMWLIPSQLQHRVVNDNSH